MLDYARAGDTVVVAAIDRLGGSIAEVTAPSHISVSIESCCVPCGKESIPPHRPVEPWRPSWPPLPNLKLNEAKNVAPHLGNPAGTSAATYEAHEADRGWTRTASPACRDR